MPVLAVALVLLGLLLLFSGLNQWRWVWAVLWRDGQGRSALQRYGLLTTRVIYAAVGTALILFGIFAWRPRPVLAAAAVGIIGALWVYLALRGPGAKKKR